MNLGQTCTFFLRLNRGSFPSFSFFPPVNKRAEGLASFFFSCFIFRASGPEVCFGVFPPPSFSPLGVWRLAFGFPSLPFLGKTGETFPFPPFFPFFPPWPRAGRRPGASFPHGPTLTHATLPPLFSSARPHYGDMIPPPSPTGVPIVLGGPFSFPPFFPLFLSPGRKVHADAG